VTPPGKVAIVNASADKQQEVWDAKSTARHAGETHWKSAFLFLQRSVSSPASAGPDNIKPGLSS
jgi:hypothetical protein